VKISRRTILKSAGGAAVALPLLEGLAPRDAEAAGEGDSSFAIFFRQACGVACAQTTGEIGDEPERFWPDNEGPMTAADVQGRALDEISDYIDRTLAVKINEENFDYGDGHARGSMQALTASPAVVPAAGGASEAAGMSLDHRIGADLNADGRDSLFMYAGVNSGWLGGACISYRGPGDRRAPLHNPLNAYQTMMGVDSAQFDEIVQRQKSVNDLVRGQMNDLLSRSELSAQDRQRLDLHLQSIRDLENGLLCNLSADEQAVLDGMSPGYDSDDGDQVLSAAKAHMKIAALAVACGYTRSVAIQVGNGNDGNTRYRNLETNQLMENYHYISHRRLSHDSTGTIIPNADLLHHYVDRNFGQTFKFLLDELSAYMLPTGETLLDCGLAIWYNDSGNGPGHSSKNVPFVIVGSASGYLRQGLYIKPQGDPNHSQLLNTIGAAVGVKNANGGPLDDFGDPSQPTGQLSELLA
jgi:hypothetical protein